MGDSDDMEAKYNNKKYYYLIGMQHRVLFNYNEIFYDQKIIKKMTKSEEIELTKEYEHKCWAFFCEKLDKRARDQLIKLLKTDLSKCVAKFKNTE